LTRPWRSDTYNIGTNLPQGGDDTKPPIIPTLKQARDDLGATTGRLLAAFSSAVSDAAQYCASKGERDRAFFSHLVRYLAKIELNGDGMQPEDWELEDTANSGICLTHADYRVRVLKAAVDGEAPDPGNSERRKRFLQQLPEQQMSLPFIHSEEVDAENSSEEKAEPVHIMYLWEADSRDSFSGLWFTCPNGAGKYHFKEWIPFGGEELEAPGTPMNPPSEPPPAELGFTKKPDEAQRDKTGTDDKTGNDTEE
jgi:hypothetical protein